MSVSRAIATSRSRCPISRAPSCSSLYRAAPHSSTAIGPRRDPKNHADPLAADSTQSVGDPEHQATYDRERTPRPVSLRIVIIRSASGRLDLLGPGYASAQAKSSAPRSRHLGESACTMGMVSQSAYARRRAGQRLAEIAHHAVPAAPRRTPRGLGPSTPWLGVRRRTAS
jgi:hypothetical protein